MRRFLAMNVTVDVVKLCECKLKTPYFVAAILECKGEENLAVESDKTETSSLFFFLMIHLSHILLGRAALNNSALE